MINYYKFTPLVKTLIWGTESWQISGVPGNETPCDGQKLNDLVKALKGQLVGEANYQRFGDEFPLLIKFIDAHQDLSIQVQPTDEIAHRQGKPRGKTEMWYVMDSQPTAKLYNGLKMQITPDQYKEMVANDTICDALAQYHVHEGDCFFIPAGSLLVASTPLGQGVIWQRSSRPRMSPTASTTTSGATKTATCDSCTPRRLLRASTTPSCRTIGSTILPRRTRVSCWWNVPISTRRSTTSPNL